MPGGQSAFDTLRYNESSNPPEYPDFTAKEVQYIRVNDQQNGQYDTGQITMDLNAITQSYRFIDWKNTYWEVPVTLTLTYKTAATNFSTALYNNGAVSRALIMSLKSSHLSLVDSMTVICGNQQLISRQSWAHVPIQYRLLTKWNEADVRAFGPSIGFNGAHKTRFNTEAVGARVGFDQCDARDDVVHSKAADQVFDGTVAVTPAVGGDGVATVWGDLLSDAIGTPAVVSVGEVKSTREMNVYQKFIAHDTLRTRTKEPVLSLAGAVMTYEFIAVLPMAYVHDLFDKMPLVRGALWQLQLNLHLPFTVNFRVDKPAASGVTNRYEQYNSMLDEATPATVVTRNQYIPAHVSLASMGHVLVNTVLANQDFSLQGDIRGGANTVTTLHCAMLDFEPGPGTTYLKDPVKTVVFQDYQTIRPSAANPLKAGATTVQIPITPGLSKLRGLLIVPEAVNAVNGVSSGTMLPMSAGLSPFNTHGNTVAPFARLLEFNVSIAGHRLYDQNISYTFEQFMQNQFGVGSPSGNGVDGLRTGLINQENWSKNYGYVWVNLERHAETSDGMPMPVDVTCANGNTYDMNLTFYLFYEKEFKIDVLSGRVMI